MTSRWLKVGLVIGVGGCFGAAHANSLLSYLRPIYSSDFMFTGETLSQSETWEGERVLTKTVMVRNQGVRISYVHPSTMQGVTISDDGVSNRFYSADANYLRVRRSLYSFWPTLTQMEKWAAENYTFRKVSEGTRLGHATVTIEAKNRNPKMGSLTITAGKSLKTVFDIRAQIGERTLNQWRILEMRLAPENEFKITFPIPSDAKVEKAWGPIDIKDIKFATGALGFSPPAPDRLPYGFHTFATQLVGSESDPFFAARVTDGLLVGNVYVWRYKSGAVKSRSEIPAMVVDRRRDLAIGALGDFAPGVKEEIAKAFVSRVE